MDGRMDGRTDIATAYYVRFSNGRIKNGASILYIILPIKFYQKYLMLKKVLTL